METANWKCHVIAWLILGLGSWVQAQPLAQALTSSESLPLDPEGVITLRSAGGTVGGPYGGSGTPPHTGVLLIDLACVRKRHREATAYNPCFESAWDRIPKTDWAPDWRRRAVDTLLARSAADSRTLAQVQAEFADTGDYAAPNIAKAFPNGILLAGISWHYDSTREAYYFLAHRPALLGFMGHPVNHYMKDVRCLYEPALPGKSAARLSICFDFSEQHYFYLHFDGRWIHVVTSAWIDNTDLLEPFKPGGRTDTMYLCSEEDKDRFLVKIVNRYIWNTPNAD